VNVYGIVDSKRGHSHVTNIIAQILHDDELLLYRSCISLLFHELERIGIRQSN